MLWMLSQPLSGTAAFGNALVIDPGLMGRRLRKR
jgi:hypothetical protein